MYVCEYKISDHCLSRDVYLHRWCTYNYKPTRLLTNHFCRMYRFSFFFYSTVWHIPDIDLMPSKTLFLLWFNLLISNRKIYLFSVSMLTMPKNKLGMRNHRFKDEVRQPYKYGDCQPQVVVSNRNDWFSIKVCESCVKWQKLEVALGGYSSVGCVFVCHILISYMIQYERNVVNQNTGLSSSTNRFSSSFFILCLILNSLSLRFNIQFIFSLIFAPFLSHYSYFQIPYATSLSVS